VKFLVSLVGLFAACICFYAIDVVSAVYDFDFADLLETFHKGRGSPVVFHGRPPSQLKRQAFLRLAGASPSSKDSTTASVASASSEAATVRAPTAFEAASRSPFTDSRAST